MLLPVFCNSDALAVRGQALADSLHQPLYRQVDPRTFEGSEFVLLLDEQGLALQQTGSKAPGPIRAEFTEGAVDHRRKFGGGKGQMIAKAVGVKAGVFPNLLDVTAGLGRDSFVLASLGCQMTLLERSPVVYQLLADGLARARDFSGSSDPELAAIMNRMQLHHVDGGDYLKSLGEDRRPDVIYMDPMFPEREKSADVKKEMKAFHGIVGKDDDANDVLMAALAQARYRVVVKRPRKAAFVANKTPSHQVEGKSSRYDIYTLCKLPDRLPAV